MKRITIAFCTATLLFACNSEDTTTADSKTEDTLMASTSDAKAKTEAWVPVDSATAMRTMMEVGTPGQPHAMLAKADGEWAAESNMWWSADGQPEKGTGTSTNKMILGGRYQQSTYKGKMGEWPLEGTGTTGYDNAKKVYFTTWIDNMSTSMMNMEGTWDEATKSINFKGKMLCAANGKETEMREVYKIVDDNTHIIEMYGPDMKTGKEYKSMEIKFTRKK